MTDPMSEFKAAADALRSYFHMNTLTMRSRFIDGEKDYMLTDDYVDGAADYLDRYDAARRALDAAPPQEAHAAARDALEESGLRERVEAHDGQIHQITHHAAALERRVEALEALVEIMRKAMVQDFPATPDTPLQQAERAVIAAAEEYVERRRKWAVTHRPVDLHALIEAVEALISAREKQTAAARGREDEQNTGVAAKEGYAGRDPESDRTESGEPADCESETATPTFTPEQREAARSTPTGARWTAQQRQAAHSLFVMDGAFDDVVDRLCAELARVAHLFVERIGSESVGSHSAPACGGSAGDSPHVGVASAPGSTEEERAAGSLTNDRRPTPAADAPSEDGLTDAMIDAIRERTPDCSIARAAARAALAAFAPVVAERNALTSNYAYLRSVHKQAKADNARLSQRVAELERERDAWRAATGLASLTPSEAGERIDAREDALMSRARKAESERDAAIARAEKAERDLATREREVRDLMKHAEELRAAPPTGGSDIVLQDSVVDAGPLARAQLAEMHRLLAPVLEAAAFSPAHESASKAIERLLGQWRSGLSERVPPTSGSVEACAREIAGLCAETDHMRKLKARDAEMILRKHFPPAAAVVLPEREKLVSDIYVCSSIGVSREEAGKAADAAIRAFREANGLPAAATQKETT